MGPDTALSTAACPSCGAGVRPDAPWCSLCYHDLRPAAAPLIPEPAPAYGESDPLTAPLLDLLLPPVPAVAPESPLPAVPEPAPAQAAAGWPCLRCGTRNALEVDTCQGCFSPFLGGRDEGPSLVLPVVGDVKKLSRGNRFTLAIGAVLFVLVPLALVTFLTTAAPAPKQTTTTPTVVQQSQTQP